MIINEFLQYLRYEKNYSSHTVLSYHIDLKGFCEFLQINESELQPNAVEPLQIQQWILELSNNKMNARSIARKMSALRAFWLFLQKNGVTTHNPTKKIVLPKTKKSLPAFFKHEEMTTMLNDSFLPEDFEKVRNHLIVKLFYASGIRLSELLNIEDKDIDLRGENLRVIGKRNKERIVPLGTEICTDIKTYISLRNKDIICKDTNFFLLKSGKRMYPKAVYNIVHNAATG
ncbi:MAG: site-specific integrase, partial [Prevotellaceae bacterium]|nr:site-specific integrase [Prevotellaceae bacterium]